MADKDDEGSGGSADDSSRLNKKIANLLQGLVNARQKEGASRGAESAAKSEKRAANEEQKAAETEIEAAKEKEKLIGEQIKAAKLEEKLLKAKLSSSSGHAGGDKAKFLGKLLRPKSISDSSGGMHSSKNTWFLLLFLLVVAGLNNYIDYRLISLPLNLIIDVATLLVFLFNSNVVEQLGIPKKAIFAPFTLELLIPIISANIPFLLNSMPYLMLKLPYWGIFVLLLMFKWALSGGLDSRGGKIFIILLVLGILFFSWPYIEEMNAAQGFQTLRQKQLAAQAIAEAGRAVGEMAAESREAVGTTFDRLKCSATKGFQKLVGTPLSDCVGIGELPSGVDARIEEKSLERPVAVKLDPARNLHLYISLAEQRVTVAGQTTNLFRQQMLGRVVGFNRLDGDVQIEFRCGLEKAMSGDKDLIGRADPLSITLEKGGRLMQSLACDFDVFPDKTGSLKFYFEARIKNAVTSTTRTFMITNRDNMLARINQEKYIGMPYKRAVIDEYSSVIRDRDIDIHSANENLVIVPKIEDEITTSEDASLVIGVLPGSKIDFEIAVANNIDRYVKGEEVDIGKIEQINSLEITVPQGFELNPPNCGYDSDYLKKASDDVRTFATGGIMNQYPLDKCSLVALPSLQLGAVDIQPRTISAVANYDYTIRTEQRVNVEELPGYLQGVKFMIPVDCIMQGQLSSADFDAGIKAMVIKVDQAAAEKGIPVYAAADGVVRNVDSDYSLVSTTKITREGESVEALEGFGGYGDIGKNVGNGICIEHANGVVTEYFYLSMAKKPAVSINQEIKRGQLIGYVGNTGEDAKNEYKLRFQVRTNAEGGCAKANLKKGTFVNSYGVLRRAEEPSCTVSV